jgi:hypothetical protein
MKSLWFLIASLLDGGWHLSKFDKNTMQGTFPYGVLFEEDKAAYHFRFQWVQELMFRTGKLLNIGVRGQSITYSNKVWRAWKLKQNILYKLHFKYDRKYGVGKHVSQPYRWTINPKFPKDKKTGELLYL